MTSPSQFQLFPNSPPQNRPLNSHGRRTSRCRGTTTSVMSPVAEETKPQTQTEAVIFKIIEDTNTIISPPDTHIPRARSPTKSPTPLDAVRILERVQQPVTEQSTQETVRSQSVPLHGDVAIRPRTSSLYRPPTDHPPNRPQTASPFQPKLRVSSIPAWPAPSKRAAASPNSSRSGSATTPSPVLETPMKSMFPPYDPRFPLNKQPHYYPQRSSTDMPRQVPPRANCTTPPQNANHPLAHAENGDTWASIEELALLWDLANGEGLRGSLGTINLRLCRIDSLTFTLGNRSVPLYSLKTNSRNDIEIHRTHPSKLNTKAPVVTLSLGELSQCNDENISIALFPKLAEIFAREKAQEYCRRNQLSPPHAIQAESDAVRKAETQESCVVQWNAAAGRYDIFHSALLPPSPPSRNKHTAGLLHLTLSTPPDLPHPRPTVRITSPGFDSTALMTLDLNTRTLSLSPRTIFSTVPSLYAIDALIATLLTVTVLDDTSTIALRAMEIYEPKAEDFPNPYRLGTPCSTAAHSRSNSHGQNHIFTRNSTDILRSRCLTPSQPQPTPEIDLEAQRQPLEEHTPQTPHPSFSRPTSRSRFSQMTRRNRLSFQSINLRSPWTWIKRTFSMTPEPTEPTNLAAWPQRRSTGTHQGREQTTPGQADDIEHSAPAKQPVPVLQRIVSSVASVFAKCFQG